MFLKVIKILKGWKQVPIFLKWAQNKQNGAFCGKTVIIISLFKKNIFATAEQIGHIWERRGKKNSFQPRIYFVL